MNINADFAQSASVHAENIPWRASPAPGVERKMLDRIGDEVARATSIVRYAAGSQFPPHSHGGGEEFFVLEGVFEDERGQYPAGHYVRNPPTSRHAPGAPEGCTIFVKLWQFDPADRTEVVIDTDQLAWAGDAGTGVSSKPLFRDAHETVMLERWQAQVAIDELLPQGAELLVLSGSFIRDEVFERLSWLRLPPGARLTAAAGPDGCIIWIKRGHLAATSDRLAEPRTNG